MTELQTNEKNEIIPNAGERNLTVADRLAESGIEAKDIAIPRLLLMQSVSQLVGDGKRTMGDIIISTDETIVGGFDKPVTIVPMSLYKTLVTEDISGSSPKFVSQEPLTSANELLPFEDNVNGVPTKRSHCFNFFCLLASDVEKGEGFPVVVRFKSTSMKTGRALASHLMKRSLLNKDPYSQAIELFAAREKKDTNTYAIYKLGATRPATADEVTAARLWFPMLAQLKQKVDAIVETEASGPAPAAPTVAGGSDERF